MDVVYLCRPGENEELRYSLRSLANLPHEHVWIFGSWPSWVSAECIPVDQHRGRFRNTTASMKAACEHPDVSDPFVLMNDDFHIMEPLPEVPVLNLGPIADVIRSYEASPRNRGSLYVTDMRDTRDALVACGYREPLSFDAHTPLVVHKGTMLRALEFCEEHGLRGAHKRSVYGALVGLDGERIADVKVYNDSCPVPSGPFLSSDDACFDRVSGILAERFPAACRYEREVTVSAVVTNHDYGRYLPRCIDSALRFCDEVLVYDDGSTDDSMDVLAAYGDRIRVTHRDDATGDPVWGSNLGIAEATGTHLVFLDADNYLVSAPPLTSSDYLYAAIDVVDDDESHLKTWRWPDRPLDARKCWTRFASTLEIPFPWGGVWRTSFLAGKTWRRFESTGHAADFRTALDWCKASPALAYSDTPFLAFRKHPGQESAQRDRKAMMKAEVATVARSEHMPARPTRALQPQRWSYAITKEDEPVEMYTSERRVVRGGRLIAFAGETMTLMEAKMRGLVVGSQAAEPQVAPAPPVEPEAPKPPSRKRRPAKK